MSAPLLATPSLDDTYGAILIGLVGASTLFGFSTVRSFIYLRNHTHEARFTLWKVVVWMLWFMDTLHLAFIVHMTYVYLITDYADILSLAWVVWSFKAHVVVAVVVIIPLITVLIWATFNCNLWTDLTHLEWAVYTTFAITAVVDIFIAGSLCYLLASTRTGFASPDSIVLKIMTFVLDTGLLTSICSLTIIITCAAMPHNFIFLGVDLAVIEPMMNARYYIGADGVAGASADELKLSRSMSGIPGLNLEAAVTARERSASESVQPLSLQGCGRDLSFPGPRPYRSGT
ncbi:hypothetical protein CONPUDRAFT_142611 [Coniophora puteana RWD-64-598 SS2]|uniref:DUF6534 domain-containing protein n=1 Tax=Coniophora puteana (strain RWD-64-598) TaxID=741705 RepID=A0A5M3N031_CONPW|nr:uncharacterized protein CONPUDRAFT_142611 [Coniophora puteana RWD-64-598 SS2]EIW84251.1 hypothetical protein CONPUDRAFT_142611 [Coniophora puteana RWD-64-598 SS2]